MKHTRTKTEEHCPKAKSSFVSVVISDLFGTCVTNHSISHIYELSSSYYMTFIFFCFGQNLGSFLWFRLRRNTDIWFLSPVLYIRTVEKPYLLGIERTLHCLAPILAGNAILEIKF